MYYTLVSMKLHSSLSQYMEVFDVGKSVAVSTKGLHVWVWSLYLGSEIVVAIPR